VRTQAADTARHRLGRALRRAALPLCGRRMRARISLAAGRRAAADRAVCRPGASRGIFVTLVREFESPSDLKHNRGPIDDPQAFARDAGAASWLYLCGEEFASMEGGMSYADVQAAVPESANVVSDPPQVMDMDLAREQIAALD